MTLKVDDHHYLAIQKTDLSWGEWLVLQSKKGETVFTIASKPTSSWKVMMYGSQPGELVDSHLLELLNPATAKGMDF